MMLGPMCVMHAMQPQSRPNDHLFICISLLYVRCCQLIQSFLSVVLSDDHFNVVLMISKCAGNSQLKTIRA